MHLSRIQSLKREVRAKLGIQGGFLPNCCENNKRAAAENGKVGTETREAC